MGILGFFSSVRPTQRGLAIAGDRDRCSCLSLAALAIRCRLHLWHFNRAADISKNYVNLGTTGNISNLLMHHMFSSLIWTAKSGTASPFQACGAVITASSPDPTGPRTHNSVAG
jgi:hypothetical protein